MSPGAGYTRVGDLPHALGGPPLQGRLRSEPGDFQVDEVLGFEPDGEGEHQLLLIRKTGINTEEVSRHIARFAGLRPRDIGYCGLKDRHAVTTQWFSLGLAGRKEADWRDLAVPGLEVLKADRHRRKLRRGAARGNRFRIRVRGIEGDRRQAERRLAVLAASGVPNYFGEQRFGRDYGNLAQAQRLFDGSLKRISPHLRGLYLSAARAQVFNQVLARRVTLGTWNQGLCGDAMQLEGSRSWFLLEAADADSVRRVDALDIHPTGPLWGEGELAVAGEPAQLERGVADGFESWCEGLERFRLKQERRALRLPVYDLSGFYEGDDLVLAFRLPTGAFATSVLRELVDYSISAET